MRARTSGSGVLPPASTSILSSREIYRWWRHCSETIARILKFATIATIAAPDATRGRGIGDRSRRSISTQVIRIVELASIWPFAYTQECQIADTLTSRRGCPRTVACPSRLNATTRRSRAMRLRICGQPTGTIDGIALNHFRPGLVYDISMQLAAVFLAEGWGEPCSDSDEGRRARPPNRLAALVLVVDDHTDVRQLTADVLACNGYDVIEALDGRDGIAS